jgi:hypothetical protein
MSLTISTENQNQAKSSSNRTTEKRISEDDQRDEDENFCNNEN